ncbi:MAG: hypothetical protein U0670_23340 [Anaerolineae bacterium]
MNRPHELWERSPHVRKGDAAGGIAGQFIMAQQPMVKMLRDHIFHSFSHTLLLEPRNPSASVCKTDQA